MTNDSIHAALWEWFSECAAITRLFFNFSGTDDGDTVIAYSGDTLINAFIGGEQERRYAFDLIRFLPATYTENDSGNIEMMEDVESIVQWVQQKNEAQELPELPDGMQALSIEVLDTSTGYVAGEDQNTAKYMIPFAIEYLKN